ncbi:hypothetical protein BRADI_4g01235v3, partial [Brachypodium distachyon]
AAAKELPRPWPRIWGSVRAESLPRRGGAGARVEPCRCSILRPLAALPKNLIHEPCALGLGWGKKKLLWMHGHWKTIFFRALCYMIAESDS